MAPPKARILACALVHAEPHLFDAHLAQIKAQKLPRGVEVHLAHIIDAEGELKTALEEVCKKHGSEILPTLMPHPKEAEYAVGPVSHHWTQPTFDWLALHKQSLIEAAQREHYTHIWFVDSDLLLEPTTLASLLSIRREAVSAVLWTTWNATNSGSLGPNVWLSHPYGMQGLGIDAQKFLKSLTDRKLNRVLGGGACFLLSLDALQETQIRYHPRLPDLPQGGMWQGEDRSFAVLCQRFHVEQYADPWPDIWHCYHPQMRTPEFIETALATINFPRQEKANIGDLVNFTIEALEEPRLINIDSPSRKPKAFVRAVRCRLGQLNLLPEIEIALARLKVGAEAIINVSFPGWYEISEYAGQTKSFRIALIDVKSFGHAPVLADHLFQGVTDDKIA